MGGGIRRALAPADLAGGIPESLGWALLTGGLATVTIWAVRRAGPGDLRLPSRGWVAACMGLAALLTGALAVAAAQEVGDATVAAGLPILVGLFAATAVLAPTVGLWATPLLVAIGIGSLAALAAGLLIGEREALALLCRFACSGAALGATFAVALRRSRELEATGSPK